MEQLASGKECHYILMPMELHFRIRDELLKDLDVTHDYLKSLRLVCKLFNLIWSPVVLVNLLFFPDNLTHDFDPKKLRQLSESMTRSGMHTFNTLTLKNWRYLNTGFHYFFKRLTKLWVLDRKKALIQIPPTLILAIPVNLIIFFGSPMKIPRRLQTFFAVVGTRYCASTLPRKLQLSNVSCVRLTIHQHDTRWEVYWTTKFLTTLPNLTELVLRLPFDSDMAYIARRLKPLHALRKFTLQTYTPGRFLPPGPRSKVAFFSTVIARNPNLTHLAFRLTASAPCDLSEMLRDIPDDKPLRLEHITIDLNCKKTEALLPHIQSLSSLEARIIYNSGSAIYSVISRAPVFPSTISADYLEKELCTYLERHPGVVNLSIGHDNWPHAACCDGFRLSGIIMRHFRTLQKLRATSTMLHTLEAEVALLKCVQLRELVLVRGHSVFPAVAVADGEDIEDDIRVLDIAARLGQSLTVVIEHKTAFLECVKYCRNSENPLLRSLAGRIVYERIDGMIDLFNP